MARTKRPASDTYAEVAFAKLVNASIASGESVRVERITQCPDTEWVVEIGGLVKVRRDNIVDAVTDALNAYATRSKP